MTSCHMTKSNILCPKRCIFFQNQKVCWLFSDPVTLYQSFQYTLKNKNIKDWIPFILIALIGPSCFVPHRLSTGLMSQIEIFLMLTPLTICEVQSARVQSMRFKKCCRETFKNAIFRIWVWARVWSMNFLSSWLKLGPYLYNETSFMTPQCYFKKKIKSC